MIVKSINTTISKKVAEWISSIDDPILKKSLKDDVIVTGGCIASMLSSEKVNDFDIYFRTKETAKEVA